MNETTQVMPKLEPEENTTKEQKSEDNAERSSGVCEEKTEKIVAATNRAIGQILDNFTAIATSPSKDGSHNDQKESPLPNSTVEVQSAAANRTLNVIANVQKLVSTAQASANQLEPIYSPWL